MPEIRMRQENREYLYSMFDTGKFVCYYVGKDFGKSH